MRLVALALAVGVLGGCKKDSAPAAGGSAGSAAPAAANAAVSGSCNDAINHSVDAIIAKRKEEAEGMGSGSGSGLGPERMARLERLRAALGTSCTQDNWSPAMLACVSAVTKQPELMQCMSANLDKAQSSHAMGAIATAMMGGRPPGMGMGMHPGMDLDTAYTKRLGEVSNRLTEAQAKLAGAAAADKAQAQAVVDKLTREKDALEKSFAQMKAMHPGPLQGMSAGSGSGSAGSGSAK